MLHLTAAPALCCVLLLCCPHNFAFCKSMGIHQGLQFLGNTNSFLLLVFGLVYKLYLVEPDHFQSKVDFTVFPRQYFFNIVLGVPHDLGGFPILIGGSRLYSWPLWFSGIDLPPPYRRFFVLHRHTNPGLLGQGFS